MCWFGTGVGFCCQQRYSFEVVGEDAARDATRAGDATIGVGKVLSRDCVVGLRRKLMSIGNEGLLWRWSRRCGNAVRQIDVHMSKCQSIRPGCSLIVVACHLYYHAYRALMPPIMR
jgi:hypothetical protein